MIYMAYNLYIMYLNMYMPTNIHKIYEGQKRLQEEVSTVLISIANVIVNSDNKDIYNQNCDCR
ncbi:MAG: hypothetical protein J6A15_03060 [Clostridia bacterium]|nr:hypothetical protein [Clostridia bacterium]